MRFVRRKTAAPGPSALRIDEVQFGMRLAHFRIGIAQRVAHALVHKSATEQEAEQAVGAVILTRIGQPAAAFEAAVDDGAMADARSPAKLEPGDVSSKPSR